MLLREQLDALAGERYPAWWELLVVDNRSSDNIAFVVAAYPQCRPQENDQPLGVALASQLFLSDGAATVEAWMG